MSYANPTTHAMVAKLAEQHQAVLARLDAFDAKPSRRTAAPLLKTLRAELPEHFRLEAIAGAPGCRCNEHFGFLMAARSLKPRDTGLVADLSRRIRAHIMREEHARAGL